MRLSLKSSIKKDVVATAAVNSRTIKRTAVVGMLSLASVLAFVSPASAATNIRGAEPFDTDKLVMSLCNGKTGRTYWFINVQTGQLTKDTTNGTPTNNLPYPIERFEGRCSYPKSSSWTWTGAEKRVSNVLVNCASGTQLSQNIQSNGTTTSTTTNSVTASFGIEWSIIPSVLSIEAGGSYTRSWSYAKAKGWSTTTGINVSPRRVGWMSLRPEMRTVRSNPVFHIESYSWGKPGGGQVNTTTWRGRNYRDIKSQGAYYDAIGNVLRSDNTPSGQYVARDRAVTSSDC